MKIRKFFAITGTVLVLAGLVAGAVYLRAYRAQQHARVKPMIATPWALHTAPVRLQTVTSGFKALAVKKPDFQVLVAPQISGTILMMGPREGQIVQPGTLLVRIDSSQIDDQISSLKANLASARQQMENLKKEYERKKTLLKKGFETQEKTDNARTAFIAAQKKVESLRFQLSQLETRRGYSVITSTWHGTVAARLAEPGNLASPGKPVYRLTISGKTRFSIKVPQSVLEKLHVGSTAVISSGGKVLKARLTRVNHTLDNLSMGSVEVDLASSPFKLPAGARVPARVITRQTPNALTVPVTAVAWAADGKSGFVVKAEGKGDRTTLKKIAVKIIHAGADGVAVKGDLKAGDQVVVAQQAVLLKLKTGDPAIVTPGAVQ